jgi:hypothetical protein
MKAHEYYKEQLPLLAAGQLSADESRKLHKHLEGCHSCRAEFNFWLSLSDEIATSNATVFPPADIPERALAQIRKDASTGFKASFLRTTNLLRAQAYLVKRELWPAAAALMLLGVIIAWLSGHTESLSFLAPLVAAASMAAIAGPQNDPASELTMATPTSPWKILLARLSVVSGYNLLLALIASLLLLPTLPQTFFGNLILTWLGPLAFLSTLALLLSLWIGTSNAITVTYALWIVQYLHISQLSPAWPALKAWDNFLIYFRQFWQSPVILLMLALAAVLLALVSTQHSRYSLKSILN